MVQSTVSFTLQDSGGNPVAGAVTFSTNAGNTVATFTPTNVLAFSTTYTATVSGAQNSNGTPIAGPTVWSFTTTGPQCPCSVWQNGTPTGAADSSDTSAVNLGLQFRASSSGFVAGVRFYKYSDNTGSHIGSLWSSTGTLLASGTFSGESASGWQELDFATPVAITANTTYVVSYHTDAGHYAFTQSGLSSAVTNGPLTALASGGVYAYSSANAFPSNAFNATNYWVDVVYTQTAGSTPPVVTTVTPTGGSTGNAVSVAPTATFSQAVVPNTVSFTLQALGRSYGCRLGELQHRQHGGDVHADEFAGGEHDLHRDGVGGAECLRHPDEQPRHVELHHRRGVTVPVQRLAERGTLGCGGCGRHQRGQPGSAVPGQQ